MIYKNIFQLIGNTPIVEISTSVHRLKNVTIYSKLEYYNPFGSLKDRMAWEMVKEYLPELEKNKKIVIENSSGNTAKALQVIASVYGSHLKTITNRIKNPEKKMILQLLGAQVEELPGASQCYDPSDPNDPLVHVEREVASHPDTYVYTNQYFNEKNVQAHYQGTGREIITELGHVDYFFSGLGTTGSTKGITKALKEASVTTTSIGVISSAADSIPGIRNAKEMFEVGLFDKNVYDEVIEMNSQEAIDGSLSLIRKAGILVGPTGGAAYQSILKYFANKPPKKPVKVIFLACDRFEWYLSYYQERRPELFGEQVKPNSLKSYVGENNLDINIRSSEVDSFSKKSDALIIDIRSNIAYKAGHIPGSINIPEDSLEQMLDRAKPFPKDTKVIFACPNGDRSKRLASYSQKQGYQAYSLEAGILSWRTQGFPMETTI